MKRVVASAALVAALIFEAHPAEAHLMAAGQGTVNVVGAELYAAVSVPTSALHDADDDGDGTLDARELERHEEALRAEADRRLILRDGEALARTVRVDLILSPEHDATRADHVVVLKHAELDAPPADLRVQCDLFAAGASGHPLTITATRHPAIGGTETEVAVLTAHAADHRFFEPATGSSSAGCHCTTHTGPPPGSGVYGAGAGSLLFLVVIRRRRKSALGCVAV